MNTLTNEEKEKGYQLLFDGKSLEGWSATSNAESWTTEDGTIHCTAEQKSGYLYSHEQFDDFILSVDFKIDPEVNSGIFFRWSELSDPVNTGLEMQVLDTYNNDTIGIHDCGALYELVPPSKRAERPAGEWNHSEIECRGSQVKITLNDVSVVEADLNRWDTAGKNPDGNPNKFTYAWRDMPHRGRIGLQNHGGRAWFQNMKLLPLK